MMVVVITRAVMVGQQQMKAKHGQEEESMAAYRKDIASNVDELVSIDRQVCFH